MIVPSKALKDLSKGPRLDAERLKIQELDHGGLDCGGSIRSKCLSFRCILKIGPWHN